MVVDLKKTAGEDAQALGKLEEEQEDARVLYVALTRSAARCYVYHAPVKISEKARVPAQVRMMRSWGSRAEASESEGSGSTEANAIQEQAQSWVSGLSGQAEYVSFSDGQSDFQGEENPVLVNSQDDSLEARHWEPDCKIPRAKIVDSFSGLSKQVGFDGRDLDGISEGQDKQQDFLGEEKTPIFKFPAGANAGSFMHDVFEHLEFSDSSNWESFIEEKLKEHQYDSKKWTSVILGMVKEVMGTELEPGFSLNKLEKEDRLEEMEFHFPMAPGFLPELAGSLPDSSILKKYLVRLNPYVVAELGVRLPQGFGGPDFQGKWKIPRLGLEIEQAWRKRRRLRSERNGKGNAHPSLRSAVSSLRGGRSPFPPKQNEGLLIPNKLRGCVLSFRARNERRFRKRNLFRFAGSRNGTDFGKLSCFGDMSATKQEERDWELEALASAISSFSSVGEKKARRWPV